MPRFVFPVFLVLLGGCSVSPLAPVPPALPAEVSLACSQLPDQTLIGMDESQLVVQLDGCSWRIVERNGVGQPVTLDFLHERRNLKLQNGVVVEVTRG